VDKFIKKGCTPFSLGERILQVEQAVPFIIGKIS
jgi:16S rRNA U1498 N3-methylase RsmE